VRPSATAAALAARLDRLPLSRFHWKLLLVSGLGWMFDAMDTLIIAAVAAAAVREWAPGSGAGVEATRRDLVALITTANMAGFFFGSLIFSWLAGRLGRKAVLQLTLPLASVATGLSALGPSAEALALIRVIAGLGLGGALPVASMLVSEFAPAARRGFMLVLLESFWIYGAVLAALISFVVIGPLGQSWRVVLLIGALPVLYVIVLHYALLESPRLLARKGRLEEAEAIVHTVEHQAGVHQPPSHLHFPPELTHPGAGEPRTRVVALFSPQFLPRTLVLWVIWAVMNVSYYGCFLWLPSLLVQQGLSLERSLGYTLLITLAQVPGYFSALWLVERLGCKWALALYLLLAALGAFFTGRVALVSSDAAGILLWGSVLSFSLLGAWGIVHTYTPELYPTWLRGTGAGWAAAFGRAFAFLAPPAVPWLIALGGGPEGAFLAFTEILLAGGLVVLVLGPETGGRTLEEVAGA
jgi:putative MFS transporter